MGGLKQLVSTRECFGELTEVAFGNGETVARIGEVNDFGARKVRAE
jgi:hypothetical protein